MKDILDLHTHTIASGHAYNTLYEMARSAADRGLQLLGVTEHAPAMPGTCNALYFVNFRVIPRNLFGVKILMGAELNILDCEGKVDLTPRQLAGLDIGIASIHPPCFTCGTAAQNTAAYLNVMKNPYIQIIGHPDDDRFPIDYEALVCAAKEHHVLLEVNASSFDPLSARKGARAAYLEMLPLCARYGVSIILDSDAHCEADIGNHAAAIALLEETGFPEELIVNTDIRKAAAFIPALSRQEYQ